MGAEVLEFIGGRGFDTARLDEPFETAPADAQRPPPETHGFEIALVDEAVNLAGGEGKKAGGGGAVEELAGGRKWIHGMVFSRAVKWEHAARRARRARRGRRPFIPPGDKAWRRLESLLGAYGFAVFFLAARAIPAIGRTDYRRPADRSRKTRSAASNTWSPFVSGPRASSTGSAPSSHCVTSQTLGGWEVGLGAGLGDGDTVGACVGEAEGEAVGAGVSVETGVAVSAGLALGETLALGEGDGDTLGVGDAVGGGESAECAKRQKESGAPRRKGKQARSDSHWKNPVNLNCSRAPRSRAGRIPCAPFTVLNSFYSPPGYRSIRRNGLAWQRGHPSDPLEGRKFPSCPLPQNARPGAEKSQRDCITQPRVSAARRATLGTDGKSRLP